MLEYFFGGVYFFMLRMLYSITGISSSDVKCLSVLSAVEQLLEFSHHCPAILSCISKFFIKMMTSSLASIFYLAVMDIFYAVCFTQSFFTQTFRSLTGMDSLNKKINGMELIIFPFTWLQLKRL